MPECAPGAQPSARPRQRRLDQQHGADIGEHLGDPRHRSGRAALGVDAAVPAPAHPVARQQTGGRRTHSGLLSTRSNRRPRTRGEHVAPPHLHTCTAHDGTVESGRDDRPQGQSTAITAAAPARTAASARAPTRCHPAPPYTPGRRTTEASADHYRNNAADRAQARRRRRERYGPAVTSHESKVGGSPGLAARGIDTVLIADTPALVCGYLDFVRLDWTRVWSRGYRSPSSAPGRSAATAATGRRLTTARHQAGGTNTCRFAGARMSPRGNMPRCRNPACRIRTPSSRSRNRQRDVRQVRERVLPGVARTPVGRSPRRSRFPGGRRRRTSGPRKGTVRFTRPGFVQALRP
jgi:hypothetical protein